MAIAAEGVPCMSGVCSEIYLEKAFDPIRPAHRLPVAQRVRPRKCAPLGTAACAAWCGSVLRAAHGTAAPQRCVQGGLIAILARRHCVQLGETSLAFLCHPTMSDADATDVCCAIDKVMAVASATPPLPPT